MTTYTHSDNSYYLRLLLTTFNRLILFVTGAIMSLISLHFIICQFGNYLNNFETKSSKYSKCTLTQDILLPLLHRTNTLHAHTFTQNNKKFNRIQNVMEPSSQIMGLLFLIFFPDNFEQDSDSDIGLV